MTTKKLPAAIRQKINKQAHRNALIYEQAEVARLLRLAALPDTPTTDELMDEEFPDALTWGEVFSKAFPDAATIDEVFPDALTMEEAFSEFFPDALTTDEEFP